MQRDSVCGGQPAQDRHGGAQVVQRVRQRPHRLIQWMKKIVPMDQNHPTGADRADRLVPVFRDVRLRQHTKLSDSQVDHLCRVPRQRTAHVSRTALNQQPLPGGYMVNEG